MSEYLVVGLVLAAFGMAGVLTYLLTPHVKDFAHQVGAIDVPRDARRMHKEPIPRLGGLAIFMGFLASALVFGKWDVSMLSILLGAMIIVVLGIFDDIVSLGAKFKFLIIMLVSVVGNA